MSCARHEVFTSTAGNTTNFNYEGVLRYVDKVKIPPPQWLPVADKQCFRTKSGYVLVVYCIEHEKTNRSKTARFMATAGTMSRQSVWPSNPQRTDCVVIRPSSTPPALEIAPQTRKSVAFDNTTFCRQPNINSLDNNATSIDTVVNSNEIVFITVALGIALKLSKLKG